MSIIKVRKQSLDRIGHKTVRLIYDESPAVRSMVHSWYDGEHEFLLTRGMREFLRRLVVRSLREIMLSNENVLPYGEPLGDVELLDNVFPETDCRLEFDLREGDKFDFQRFEEVHCQCSRCECGTDVPMVVKSTKTGLFAILCRDCRRMSNIS